MLQVPLVLELVLVETCLVVSACLVALQCLPSLPFICSEHKLSFILQGFFLFSFFLNDFKNPFSEWVDYYTQREILKFCDTVESLITFKSTGDVACW